MRGGQRGRQEQVFSCKGRSALSFGGDGGGQLLLERELQWSLRFSHQNHASQVTGSQSFSVCTLSHKKPDESVNLTQVKIQQCAESDSISNFSFVASETIGYLKISTARWCTILFPQPRSPEVLSGQSCSLVQDSHVHWSSDCALNRECNLST